MSSTNNGTDTINAAARDAAMQAMRQVSVTPTGIVEYRSKGKVIIIGGDEAIECAPRVNENLQAQVLLLEGSEEPGVPLVPAGGRKISIDGYLGAFTISLGEPGKPNFEQMTADMILDLGAKPQLTMSMKPPGYVVATSDSVATGDALQTLQDLVGTFEKPRYFNYNADICAHSRSGKAGCNRCIDACPAYAIISIGEKIEVNPNLCQGGGICSTVCPTGAITYAYPSAADSLNRLRVLLQTYTTKGGQDPVVAIVAEHDVDGVDDAMPSNILLFAVEELASVGLDFWLAALAYGAKAVRLIDTASNPDWVRSLLVEQIGFVTPMVTGLGYPAEAIRMMTAIELAADMPTVMPAIKPATFGGLTEKRRVAYLALDHLFEQATTPNAFIDLPAGAPFGAIEIDKQRCTLCLACTSACPASAVTAGGDGPQLVFNETNCVQCGICQSTCPEQAIHLIPRFIADPSQRQRAELLHSEEPFCCVNCGKPFAPKAAIEKMLSKLEDHYMFQGAKARQRLKMCEDCRVVDVVQDNEAMGRGLPPVVRH